MTDHFRFDGHLVAQAPLNRGLGFGALDEVTVNDVSLYRDPAAGTWQLLTIHRWEKFGDEDDRPTKADVDVTLSHPITTVAELEESIRDAYNGRGWVELLDACGDPYIDPDLARAWAETRIERDFDRASIYHRDLEYVGSLGNPTPGPGRQLPDWEANARAAMEAKLTDDDIGYELLDEPPVRVTPSANPVGDPIVGVIGLRRYRHDFAGIIRVDAAGEIFVRLPHRDDVEGPLLVPAPEEPW